jgi:hypothetical protein
LRGLLQFVPLFDLVSSSFKRSQGTDSPDKG